MSTTLYIIGVGPGDPDLLTRKAFILLNQCPVIATPNGSKNGISTALSIVEKAMDISHKEVHNLHFPMQKIHGDTGPSNDVQKAWTSAAKQVIALLAEGKDVVFPTLGDPAIYSTGYYLYETILSLQKNTNIIFVPGIAAMSSCSAATSVPICLGDDKLAVIPATFSMHDIQDILENFDTIVLMKVHKVLDGLITLFTKLDLLEKAVLVERAGMEDECIHTNLQNIQGQVHYFSTIIVRKRL
jgi:precorrin-2/cobalt-factor-2 C20-methyltransferase